MATKKKTDSKATKRKIARAPSLNERITDFSLGASSDFITLPKKKKKK